MAKKIIEAAPTKKASSKSKIDVSKVAKTIMENEDAIEKIADGIGDLVKKSKSTSKTTKKKSSKSDSVSKVLDIASTFLNK